MEEFRHKNIEHGHVKSLFTKAATVETLKEQNQIDVNKLKRKVLKSTSEKIRNYTIIELVQITQGT